MNSLSVLFVLFLGICCEATETPYFVQNDIILSSKTGNETQRQIFKDITERGERSQLHPKDILSRLKRSSNSCPPYHYPLSGNCEPCICGKGEQPKENCGYGPDGPVSDRCEPCKDNHFSTDGRINGCEVCTDCGQRGFQTTCNRTQDATCACEEGQKLGQTDQCLPVCCKCYSPEVTDNANACPRAFGSPAKDGGYLCTDNEFYAYQPCQDYQPPTTPHPTTTPTTNESTPVLATTTGQGTTTRFTNKTTALPDGTTKIQPSGTPSDEPSHDHGHQYLELILGLGIGFGALFTVFVLVGVGRKWKKIYRGVKCMKKCWEGKPTTDTAKAALLHEDHVPSDVESAPDVSEVPPDVQCEEQKETGETTGQGEGQPDDAVPFFADDDPPTSDNAEETGDPGDKSDDETDPKDPVSDEADFPETMDEEGATNDHDSVPHIPEFIQRMPLEKILDDEDLLGKMKVKLERFDRHYRNIGSYYGLDHDEVNHIEFKELSSKDSPFKAILEKVMSENITPESKMSEVEMTENKTSKNKTVGELLQYLCSEKLKRRDVVCTVVDYLVKKEQERQESDMKVKGGIAEQSVAGEKVEPSDINGMTFELVERKGPRSTPFL